MSDREQPESHDYGLNGMVKIPDRAGGEPSTFMVDIGEDGGTLKIVYTDPVQYEINGKAATKDEADAWIKRWRDIVDAAKALGDTAP